MRLNSLREKKEDTFDYSLARVCKNCENTFAGRFCNRCGEKVLEPSDKKFIHFLESVFHGFTHADNKFFYTLRLMLTKTGYVTDKYIQGIRVRFIKPVSMFLVFNLLYFLFPNADTFNSSLYTQMNNLSYSHVASKMVEKRIEKESTTLKEFTSRYEHHSTSMAKLLLILFVVVMAVPIAIINFSKSKYFADHLMVSVEVNSLALLICIIGYPWLMTLLNLIFTPSTNYLMITTRRDMVSSAVAMIYLLIAFFFMERRVYNQRILPGVLKAVLLVPCFVVALQVYRAILFFATMLTLH